ncbi:MAG: protein kinase, partial [Treponema sp.]|nr:protein kinase [Treponema sp.]
MDLESVIGEFQETFEGQTFPEEISRRFHVTERLGINEFGETFLMSEKNGGKLFVLKRCQKSDATTANEAEILRGLEHEGLPVYESVIESDTDIFVSRRYIKGITLDEYIEKGDTADKELIVDTMIALCGILEFLHSQPVPIIHRDIKPSNIIINPEEGTVSLIDFGISRKYSEDSGNDTMCLGTRNFAPPEQYGFAQTDCRSDIYSLGVVLRYWLTGSIGRYAEMDDNALARIVAKGTMLDPEMRYRNVAALKKELGNYKNRVRQRVHRDYLPGKNDVEIRNVTARELVGRIGAGWCLGNAFDAHDLTWLGDTLTAEIAELETAWLAQGPGIDYVTTQSLIAEISRARFNAITIPVTWYKVADPDKDWAIRPDWMERIEEVVGWAYDLGMIVIIDTRHEHVIFSQMTTNPAESERILTRIWEQVAGRFNNQFGERLVFKAMDKPR